MVSEDRRQVALQTRVGAFILTALIVLLTLVYFLGRSGQYFEAKYFVNAEFEGVGGLVEGATVRLAGVPVGRVSKISLPAENGGRIRVALGLTKKVQNRIRNDSVARIETLGLLGDKIVEVSLGSPDAPPLKEGETIRTQEPIEVNRLVGQGAEVLKDVDGLVRELRAAVQTVNDSKAVENLSATLSASRRIAEQIEKGEGFLHRLVYDKGGGSAFGDLARAGGALSRIANEVEQGKGTLHALIYDEPLALRRLNEVLEVTRRLLADTERGESAVAVLMSAESGRAARHFLQAMEDLSALTREVKSSDGLLQTLLFDPEYKSVARDLQVLARNLREVSERLSKGQGLLGSLIQGESGRDLSSTLEDLQVAIKNLRGITDDIASGRGSLGALIQDPTVYENLAAVLEGAQRSVILRSLIRFTINKGKDSGASGSGKDAR
jgi:phospholipid/cholesterol/gamma-HCH transport system substrate-binding protein